MRVHHESFGPAAILLKNLVSVSRHEDGPDLIVFDAAAVNNGIGSETMAGGLRVMVSHLNPIVETLIPNLFRLTVVRNEQCSI